MKKIIFLLLSSFLFIAFTNAQVDSTLLKSKKVANKFNTKQYYLESSKTRETIGLSLVGIGTIGIIAGIDRAIHPQGNWDFMGEFVILQGLFLNAISIPLFISSAHRARKAAQF